MWLADSSGTDLKIAKPISEATKHLSRGAIVAVKGLGGFHLAVDASQNEAVKRLRLRKGREEKPLALMSSSPEQIERYALVEDEERQLLTSSQRPIVIVPSYRKTPSPPKWLQGIALSG